MEMLAQSEYHDACLADMHGIRLFCTQTPRSGYTIAVLLIVSASQM